ncbi:MAG: HD domain-containing protein [Patescibacteria group bacterium]|jgi:putative nucleotidyltransferase with HDIG domain
MGNVGEIREWVKKQFEPEDYQYHILGVVKYALWLAKAYKVDPEVVELAALLHDIGRADTTHDEDHHLAGVPIAEKILREHNYSDEVIAEVKHCIESHRSNEGPEPETILAKIIANADAMVHFDHIPLFFYWRAKQGVKFEDIVSWVDKKLERNWTTKITLPEARELMKTKYLSAKMMLSAMH